MTAEATTLDGLETPRLLVDIERMEANIARLHGRLAARGVTLRPHVKTSKSVEISRLLTVGQAGGVTVSTLHEADVFADAGFSDILYAVGLAPNKLAHAARLLKAGVALTVVTDNLAMADAIGAFGVREGLCFPVLIEIDCDGHRSGMRPGDPGLAVLAARLATGPGTRFDGIMTHAGGAYDSTSAAGIVAAAEAERASMVAVAADLRDRGLACKVVSVGSTPTTMFGADFTGVTEVRAGVFVFYDLMMAQLGVCGLDDIALSVLTTVIGHQPEKNWVITDAGWTALSTDGGGAPYGFGQVCDLAGRPIEGLCVQAVNQEHGILADRLGRPLDPAAYPVGTFLRILPVHACATASSHRAYALVRDGAVVGSWPRLSGW